MIHIAVFDASRRRRRDAGVSLIEVLIAITILGMVATALLAATRTSIIGSATERDHARSHQWLQSATEVLVNDIDWEDCNPADSAGSAASLRTTYESKLQADPDIVPFGWSTYQVSIPIPVEFAGPDATYGAVCYEVEDRQKVTIQVQDPEGEIIETVEVVKVP